MTIRERIKRAFCWLLAPLFELWLQIVSPQVRVIVFHQILDQDRFTKIIDQLSRSIHWITPTELEDYLAGRLKFRRHSMLLTFDDGFYSQFQAAQKVLNPRGIKAIFFINPPFMEMSHEKVLPFIQNNMKVIDHPIISSNPRENMIWEDTQALIKQGHTIGSHTSTHSLLNRALSQDEIQLEFIDSAQHILDHTGQSPRHFAVPFGGIKMINRENIRILLKHYGYVHTSIRGTESHFQRVIFRETIHPEDPLFYSDLVARGLFSWLYFSIRKRMSKWLV